MDKIYEVKKDLISDDFISLGYEILPFDITGNDVVVAKLIKFPFDHSLPQQAINNVLNNPLWQKHIFAEEGFVEFLTSIGIVFEDYVTENGEKKYYVVENEELQELVCSWRVEVNLSDEDRWLGFTASDIFLENVYFNVKMLNEYCKKEVQELLELGYISIKEV
jgi:hypothetical protein